VYGNDIEDANGGNLDVSNDPSIGLGFSWHISPSTKGQVLISYVSHEFKNTNTGASEDFNLLYTHFSGIKLMTFKQFTTSVEVGIGGAYIDTDFESGVYPSATIAAGARYKISHTTAMVAELRGYATLTDDDDDFFCDGDNCVADFGSGVYYDASINFGLVFEF